MSTFLSICLYFFSLTLYWLALIILDIISICTTNAIVTEVTTIITLIIMWFISFFVVSQKMKSIKTNVSKAFTVISMKKNSIFDLAYWFLLLGYIDPNLWWGMLIHILGLGVMGFVCIKKHYFHQGIFCVLLGYYVYRCELLDENQEPVQKVILSKKELVMWENEAIDCWEFTKNILVEGVKYNRKLVS